MDKKAIEELIEIMDKADLTALRLDEGGTKIELERTHTTVGLGSPSLLGVAERVGALLDGKNRSHEDAAAPEADDDSDGTTIVRSPMVGMFYVSPSPDEEPFVKPGQEVLSGQALAIVEAMKMMNEITAPTAGVITAVLAANGDQVEYDQPLFRITPSQDVR